MSTNEKVYVIDSVKKMRPRGTRSALKGSGESVLDEAAPGEGTRPSPAESTARIERLEDKGSPALALLSFLAGPFALLATRHGRQSAFYIWIAAASTTLAAALVGLSARGIFPRARQGFDIESLVWLLAVCATTIMGFTAWARGVALTGRIKAPLFKRLPEIMRHPATVGVLGFMVPGFGLHAAGAPKRAACALWMVSFVILPVVVLGRASAIWRWNAENTILQMRPDTLENVFIAMGIMGCVGAVSWIIQALDGMRIAGQRPGREARPQGDLAALALLAAIIAFIATFQPTEIAVTLHSFGATAREEGMRIVPLYASTVAMHLDPSRPEYVLAAIESNESLGRIDRAESLKNDLAGRWYTYEQSMRLHQASMLP